MGCDTEFVHGHIWLGWVVRHSQSVQGRYESLIEKVRLHFQRAGEDRQQALAERFERRTGKSVQQVLDEGA